MTSGSCDRAEDPLSDALRAELDALADRTALEGPWQSGAVQALARHGACAAFVPEEHGGTGAAEPTLAAILAAVAERCLTTALALSQWAAAVRIIAGGPNHVRATFLPPLARGEAWTTVGISQLTTSRRHVGAPALAATPGVGGWRLDGLCPWVTGADSSATVVTGAAAADGRQIFCIVPLDAPGVGFGPPLDLLALSGSRTAAVTFAGVRPAEVVAVTDSGGPRRQATGGLATTALALGAARASLGILRGEAAGRPALGPVAAEFDREAGALADRLATAAAGGIEPADRDRLRADANSLVLRTAQAALAASKGSGFVRGHPAERLVRESLFFVVWSCPQAVTDALLCDLAGVS